MVKSLEHISNDVDSIANPVKRLRFVSLVVGTGLTAVGHNWRGAEEESWLQTNAETIFFWIGLTVLILTNLVLVLLIGKPLKFQKVFMLRSKETKI